MPENEGERRFTEDEFALILRRAIQLDTESARVPKAAPPPPVLPPEGLTLAEIKEIAAEVGIDPDRVVEAVDAMGSPDWSLPARVFGGPVKMNAERPLARLLPPEELGRLLDVPRRLLRTAGESHEVLGGVEWKSASKLTPVSIRISPEGEGARLNVSVERGGAAFLSHYVPILWGLGIAGISIGVLDPTAGLAMVGIMAAGAASGYVVARAIWVKATRNWQDLLKRLASEMSDLSDSSTDPSRSQDRLRGTDEPFPG